MEDNPANQKLATYILQGRGHVVEIAGDGQEAVSLTEQNRYDVILMDVQMPGMNGLEATAAIRPSAKRATTADAAADYRHDCPRHEGRPRTVSGGRDGRLSLQADQQSRIDRAGGDVGCRYARYRSYRGFVGAWLAPAGWALDCLRL